MSTPIISSFDNQDIRAEFEPQIRIQVEPEQQKVAEVSREKVVQHTPVLPGVVFTVVILLLLGFVTYKITDPETLPIRNVSVTGEFTHLSPVGLQERVSNIVRGGFFSVNVEMMQEALLEEPWIQQVAVKRVWPDRIIVIIKEQKPVAQWGEKGLLNADAEIFYPERSTFPENLPVVSGPENTNEFVLEYFLRINEILPEGLTLQSLSLSDRRSWELRLTTGPVIRLGKTGIVSRLQRFLQQLPAGGFASLEQVQYIDMRYTNGFALQMKTDNKSEPEVKQETYGKKI